MRDPHGQKDPERGSFPGWKSELVMAKFLSKGMAVACQADGLTSAARGSPG